jgi:hypothetical protein
MKEEQAKALREPFPPSAIGRLPKAGLQLEYVGHAATTDRLLQVDPDWTWEPMARDDRGLPALDEQGNLWILLTVCGVTRPGVGDGPSAKERIGDAIRNGAMRFGVALDLWAKEDLQAGDGEAADIQRRQRERIERRAGGEPQADGKPSDGQKTALNTLYGTLTKTEAINVEQIYAAVAKLRNVGVDEMIVILEGRKQDGSLSFAKLRDSLTKQEASNLIDRLGRLADNAGVAA